MYNQQLKTFIHVADSGSFNKAAEALYITPPAVIKQINSLEARLGLRLFNRTHRGLLLTEAGKSLYTDAVYIIKYCEAAVSRAQNSLQDDTNVIRIGSSPMTPGQFLLGLWPQIQAKCPKIKFKLIPYANTPQNAREILKTLGQNIDIVAGIFDNKLLESRQCAALELAQEPVRCAVSIYSDLARKDFLNIEDLYGQNFLLIKSGWNTYLDRLRTTLQQEHPAVNIVDFDFFDMEIFNQCANSNDVMLAIDNWKDVHPLLKILPVAWEHRVPFGLFHAPKPAQTVRSFLQALQEIVHK